jgi:hypothetical protein
MLPLRFLLNKSIGAVGEKFLPHCAFCGNAKWRSHPYAPFFLIQQGNSGSRKK